MLDFIYYNKNYIFLIQLIASITQIIVFNHIIIELINFLNKLNLDNKKISKETNTYEPDYQYLLESPDNYVFNSNSIDSIVYNSSPLVKCLDDFCKLNCVYDKGAIISLSGGVDSMVTLVILIYLQKTHEFPIFSASIDYGLRERNQVMNLFF